MRMRSPSLRLPAALLTGLGMLSGCAVYASHDSPNSRPGAQAKLYDATGREAGFVMLTQQKEGELAGVLNVNGIVPGSHGIHIHSVGKCEAPGFTTAGPHLNPEGKQHGLMNPAGAHEGDLPDVVVAADGTGHATFVAKSNLPALFDADGAAFVVHAGPDDMKTDPSGNSGARILCGVLEKVGG